MLENFTFLGVAKYRSGVLAAGLALGVVAMSSTGSMAMNPLNWGDPGAGLLSNSFGAPTLVQITDPSTAGSFLNDGTLVTPNTLSPTGTGIFDPFVQHDRSSGNCNNSDCLVTTGPGGNLAPYQHGFNTDNPNSSPNFSTQNGSGPNDHTRAVTMSEFNLTGGGGFIELVLDANQEGPPGEGKNHIVITNMQIFIGAGLDNPEATGGGIDNTGYDGTLFDGADSINGVTQAGPNDGDNTLLGQSPVWELDSATNGNIDILLAASICDNNGQCGSGQGDLSVFVEVDDLGPGAFVGSNNFVLYVEYLYANDGFEEWKFRTAQLERVSEPGTLAVFGLGIIGLGIARRRRLNRNAKP